MNDSPGLRRQLAKIAKNIVAHEKRLSIVERSAQAKYVSITDGSTTYYDTEGNPVVVVGRQPDGVYTTVDQNGPTLLAPSVPVLASQPGVLSITWNGLDQYGGATWPSHFSHVEAHVSDAPAFVPTDATEVATFHGVKGGAITLALDADLYFVKLVAVNTSGAESAPSDEVFLSVEQVSSVEAYRQDTPPTGLTLDNFGSIWYDTNDRNKQYFWDGLDWISVSDTAIDESVNSYIVEYAVDASETVAPVTGWSTTTPTRTPGTFVWMRTTVTRNDGSTATTSPALLTGNTGATGAPGTPAATIALAATTQILASPAGGGATTPATSTVTGTALNTTISAWDYSVDGAAFSASVPAGVSRTGNVVTITGTTMTARTIAVRMGNGAGISDTMTIAKVVDGATGGTGGTGPAGADAYTVLLTNEAQTFAGSTTAALAGSATSQVIAYKASVQQTATIGTITGQVTGLTTAITNNGTTTAGFTVTVTTALTQQGGTLTVPVTVGGVAFTKLFSWSVSYAGATGAAGSPAPTIDLTASSQVLAVPAAGGATNPTTSTVTGTATNTTITAWTYSVDGAAFSATVPAGVGRAANVVTITGSTMTARTIAVRMADANGVADTLTVAKISDGATGSTGGTGPAGADAYTVILTNEAFVFPGSTTAALAGSTTSQVLSYKGAAAIATTIGTITGQVTGLTTAITNNGTTSAGFTVTVTTALTATSGELTVPVTVDGISFTKKFAWTVSRAGAAGAAGTNAALVYLTSTAQALIVPAAGGATTPATSTVTGTAVNTTITAWDYSVDGAAFSATLPTGVGRTGNVVTVTGGTMTARTIAVRMADAAGVSDTTTIAKIADGATGATGGTGGTGPAGADAYTVLLTNEAQTFAAGTTNALTGSATSTVVAYKGNVQQTATVGTITGGATGISAAVTNNGTTAPLITFTVTTALTTANGTFTIPVTTNGVTFNQVFAWSLAFTGAQGTTGAAAANIDLTATTQVLASPSGGGATTPATSVVTGTATNTTITVFEYSVDGGAFSASVPTGASRTGNAVTITGATMTARTITVRMADAAGIADTITVAKTFDGAAGGTGTAGAAGYTVLLTNEASVFAGSTTAALAGSTTSQVLAYKGTVQQTATIGTITGQVTGLTTAVTNNGTTTAGFTVTVTTSLTATAGELTIPMTVDGVAFTKKFAWTVSRTGATGNTGNTGVSVTAVTPYYAQVTTGAAAPTQPAIATPAAPWVSTEPAYVDNTELYRTEKITFSDASFAYTTVFKSSAYSAATAARAGAVADLKTLWGHPSNTLFIDGADVYANSIRAQSLLLMDVNNYLSDPNVIDNTANSWAFSSGSSAVVATGTTPGYIIMNASVAGTNQSTGDAALWATEPATEYQITGEYSTVATNTGNTTFTPSLNVVNNSNTLVAAVSGDPVVLASGATSWVPFTYAAVMPANSAKFRWYPFVNGTTVNNKVWVRNVKVRRKNSGALIVDGTVVAGKLATSSVSTQNLQFGAATGTVVSSDAINGKTITGALVRSAASGDRVELSTEGLKQYKTIGGSEQVALSIGDQNKFTGEIDATSMVIRDGLQMFGKNNFMSVGSKMVLAASASAPAQPPTLAWAYDPGPALGTDLYLIAASGSSEPGATNADYVGRFFNVGGYYKANGANWTFPQMTIPGGGSEAEFKPFTSVRIAKLDTGAERVVMIGENNASRTNGYADIFLRVYDDSTMLVNGSVAPVLKYQVKIADFNWGISYKLGRVVRGSTSNRHQFTATSITDSGNVRNVSMSVYSWNNNDTQMDFVTQANLPGLIPTSETIAGIVHGNRTSLGMEGTNASIVVFMTNLRNFVYNTDTSTLEPSSDFPVTYNAQDFAWSEGSVVNNTHTAFVSANSGGGTDAHTYRYANNHKAGSINPVWASFIWRGEASTAYKTTMADPSSLSYRKMAKLKVTVPPLPAPIAGIGAARNSAADVYGWEYFLGISATTPARTAMWRQTVQPTMAANTALTLSSIDLGTYPVLSGTNPPASPNFPDSSPASIENAAGTMKVNGDGKITADEILGGAIDKLLDIISPIGTVVGNFTGVTPYKCLKLTSNPAAVSRTTYANLYAALGGASSPFGQGDGSTTFNLPVVSGRSLIGVGASGQGNTYTLGQQYGSEALAQHNHGGAGGGSFVQSGTGTGANVTTGGGGFVVGATANAGTGTSGNVPPVIGTHFFIRY